jgi:hypothetical protein
VRASKMPTMKASKAMMIRRWISSNRNCWSVMKRFPEKLHGLSRAQYSNALERTARCIGAARVIERPPTDEAERLRATTRCAVDAVVPTGMMQSNCVAVSRVSAADCAG